MGAQISGLWALTANILIIVPLMRVAQMSIVQIIHVPLVKNANMPAMLAVDMRMRFVRDRERGNNVA